ncbi:hypothetical protein BAE44_0008933 [Dichanthelium oligosanthes]|uniref:Uncharacterized protein n=1 Tax=Dichanthelium oligosanthes TaxID=888268 RepID=A0A1E5VY52_9POAL|nr:hypothetical protein BAE44_0008933 [Dichanthelium oligosanthes]
MATESEFLTAPSTPEAACSTPTAPEQDSLEIVVEQGLQQHDQGESSSMTIFRVPAHVRDANKELYEPRLVSIGPYYRGREALRTMEQHKWRYLRELLNEHHPRISLADIVGVVRDVEQKARCCYSERTDILAAAAAHGAPLGGEIEDEQSRRVIPGADDFGEMLLLDGCFVLQFFSKWHNEEQDELCDVGWGLPLLQSDLLLLENQIPFFVLEALFGLVAPEAEASDLRKSLILPHLRLSTKQLSTTEEDRATQAEEIHHLLHLLYEAVVPTADELTASAHASPPRPPPQCEVQLRQMGTQVKKAVSKRFAFIRDMPRPPRWMSLSCSMAVLREAAAWFRKCAARLGRNAPAEPDTPPMVVPSVTLLRKAGVRFEKKASPQNMFDVTFDAATGVVRMPRLEVDTANKPLLVNLVAFEQTASRDGLRGAAKPMSSYTALVSFLVKKGKDVKHLQKRGIVDNLLGSDDDAATKFFQQLGDCSSLDYGDHVFAALFTDLRQYYQSSWRRHKAKFLREHCKSPWAVLALVVAGCAFCFALFKFSTTIYGLAHPYCRC